MKLRSKFLIFFVGTLFTSLIVFVAISVVGYSKDKISSVKEKASSDVSVIASQVSELVQTNGESILYDEKVQKLFERDDLSDRYLVDKGGNIVAGNSALLGKPFGDSVSLNTLSRINMTTFASGVFEGADNQSEKILVAYSSVPNANQFVLQVYKLSEVNRFLVLFLVKIFFAFCTVGAFFLLAGYVAVGRFTKGLEILSESTDKFGSGDFTHRVEVRATDEVGSLASHFNFMAEKIQASLQMEAEKARLKLEMETAQKVQETLFLPSHYKAGNIEITGFYEAAAECGGDWWYYFKTENSVWVCVGDVTGHGVGPAMLTSSVRSAFSFIEKIPNLVPSQALSLLNRAVFETVGGKLNMTFCLIQICESESFIRYANASHEFPLILKKNTDLKRDEIIYLNDANGPRLGESIDSKYKDKELPLEKGMRIICYSDGISDVQNKEQKAFGERRFLKAVLKSNVDRKDPSAFVSSLMKDVTIYRDGTVLVDDLSLLCVDVG